MIDKESSNRLALLRFPLIVCVVYIHMYGSSGGFAHSEVGSAEGGSVATLVQNIFSEGFCRTAVPLFFLMSGYFFFLDFQWSSKGYVERLSSRVKSLLIPFLIWNFLTLAAYALVQSIPSVQGYLSNKNGRIADLDLFGYLSAIFGINRAPISYQFWFIRDLMLLVVLSPLLYVVITKLRIIFMVSLAGCWLVGAWSIYAPSAEATLFFASGAIVANNRKNLFALDYWGPVACIFYITLLLGEVLFSDTSWAPSLHRVQVSIGVLAVLFLSKFINNSEKFRNAFLSLAGASFFVFAAHEPILSVVKKIAYRLVHPNSQYAILLLYFLIPIFVIVALVYVYRASVFLMPRLIRVSTGGR